MAGRGMGAATKGGGAVGSGPRNKMMDAKSKTTGPVMMKTGGAVNQHKKMAMGELKQKIEAALAKISPEHREIVLLKDVQGLAYKEIADVMGCTIGTVMSRLFYSRQKLQTLLRDEYESR
jgi:RNA polymerase sigma factor (sigma-70 family)